MTTLDPRYLTMSELRAAGRHDEALALLRHIFDEVEAEAAPGRSSYFMPMFQLQLQLEAHAPTRAVLAALRDEQAARLLAGDLFCGTDAPPVRNTFLRVDRFLLVLEMNELLDDARATYALFRRLEAQSPELAQHYAWQVLSAMVEVGDFALADRYRRDPLELLASVNAAAQDLPLFPPPRQAPRLAADLGNLAKDVRIGIAVLRGLGDTAAADALRAALLAGLASTELRDFVQRELEEPGAITREVVARQMAQEDGQAM